MCMSLVIQLLVCSAVWGQCVMTRSCSHSFASLVSSSIQSEEWYVFQIKRHTRSIAPGGQKRTEPIKLLSCCTGSFAEAAALQALLTVIVLILGQWVFLD